MVAYNILGTHEGKSFFSEGFREDLCLLSIYTNALTNQKTDIAPYVRTYFKVTI